MIHLTADNYSVMYVIPNTVPATSIILEIKCILYNLIKLYAIEHGGSSSASPLIGSLHRLMTASQSKRDLLLGLRAPQTDDEAVLSKTYHPDYDEIVLQAKRARALMIY